MAGCVEVLRRVPDAPALAARKRFGRYKREAEKAGREAEVQESEALRQMKDAWGAWRYNDNNDVISNYLEISQRVEGLGHTAKDVGDFSFLLEAFQDEEHFRHKAGLFLSALINSGKDSTYVIHTRHLVEPLNNVGYMNEKNVTIEGDVGYGTGHMMKDGSITVNGDAGKRIGLEMQGGSVVVEGDAGENVGEEMKGGNITVKGDAGDHVGWEMQGGSVVVEGDAKGGAGIGMRGGSVVVKGDGGSAVGYRMQGGSVVVEGDVDCWLGAFMKGGSAIVEGDAGVSVGQQMKDGSIIVKGDAGHSIGGGMEGGEIRLEGDCKGLSEDIRGGRIFHKGKLVFNRGVMVAELPWHKRMWHRWRARWQKE